MELDQPMAFFYVGQNWVYGKQYCCHPLSITTSGIAVRGDLGINSTILTRNFLMPKVKAQIFKELQH